VIRGHTKDRCRLKNGQSDHAQQQWDFKISRNCLLLGFTNSRNFSLPAANMMDSILEENPFTVIYGFLAKQLQ